MDENKVFGIELVLKSLRRAPAFILPQKTLPRQGPAGKPSGRVLSAGRGPLLPEDPHESPVFLSEGVGS